MRIETLERAARECGELVLRMRKAGVTATDKDDVRGAHFVTEADVRSQELGIEIIHQHFPQEVMVAEEQDRPTSLPADFTVMDPIDGTTLFYNGGDEFGVTLCTLRAGQPVMGVINIPARSILLACERGKGVTLNGELLPRFAWKRPLDKTMLGMEVGPWSNFALAQALTSDGFVLRSILAAIYSAYEVITGHTGAFVHPEAKIWDAAAGSLMVEELGGVAVDLQGESLAWDKIPVGWVWAANQELAEAVLKHTRG